MANNQNIKPHQFDKLTADKQREIASKGGKASVEARRAKKDMTYFARLLLDETITDKKGNELPTRLAMLRSVLKKVLKDGDIQAFKTITAQAGEQPTEQSNNVVIVNNFTGLTAEAQSALEDIDGL